jgi:transcriptional regulator with XRE-family HTH domain
VKREPKKNVKERFGERIVELRRLSGRTLDELAGALEISVNSASQIENGKAFPKWQKLEPIAVFFRVEVRDLFDSRPERAMPPMLPKTPKPPRRVVRKPQSSKSHDASTQR